jgi:spore coat protein CotH
VDGHPESLKRRPNKVLDMDFGDMGPDKEAYRWNYLIQSHREEDDYSDLMAMVRTFGHTGDAFAAQIGQVIDVDQWMRLFACQSLGAVSDTYIITTYRTDALDLSWIDTTHWQATLTLDPGVENGELEAYDRHHQGVGSDTF